MENLKHGMKMEQFSFRDSTKMIFRDGTWLIYNHKGSLKYKIEYHNGFTTDRQMEIDESDYLDSLEQNKGKIADPEKIEL